MLEMPAMPWTESMYREIAAIHQRYGITPIIAHIDRYIGPFRTHGVLKRLEQLPVLIQANGSFFLQSGTARMAMRMLRKKQVHLLGSDCHNIKTRPPEIGKAYGNIKKHFGEEFLNQMNDYGYSVLS
jgi:protein-tyrosine phosphatase